MTEDVEFYYFSGTGNTYVVAKRMIEVFREKGLNVTVKRIEKEDPSEVNLSGTLGLAFPVACQSTYRFVWDFIEGLPEAQGTPVFMVDTLHSFSEAIVGPLKNFLQSIGYKPIGAKEIKMPSNFIPFMSEEPNENAVSKGIQEAEKFAEELISQKGEWKSQIFLSNLASAFFKGNITWNLMAWLGKKFRVLEDKCTKCGICVQLCPVENITMEKFPRIQGGCQQCMRCISFCPVEAIVVPGKKYHRYHAVKAGELIKGIE